MATTDIDGTPILTLGVLEVVTMLSIIRGGCYDVVVNKLKKFLNDPDVAKWLETDADPCIPAEYAADELLTEATVISEIHPAAWQITEIRCPVCGRGSCDCRDKLASIAVSFVTVSCCWNCSHRVGGIGPRGCSDGGCDLTDSKVVPPDGRCDQHKEKP